MVKLQEVEDEHFDAPQPGPTFEKPGSDDGEFVDTDSDISSDEEDDDDDDETFEETVYDRLVALKDMVPPKHRARISGAAEGLYNAVAATLRFSGSTLWVISTSAILLGVPYAMAVGEEAQMVEMEKDMKAQQLASSSLSPSSQQALLEQQQQQPQR